MHPITSRTASSAAHSRALKRIGCGARERSLGEADPEGGAHADLALHGDVAAVHLDDLPADGEPQAAPPGRARAILVHPVEPLEELAQLFLRDADAGILYLHDQLRGALFDRDVHARPRLGVLDGGWQK